MNQIPVEAEATTRSQILANICETIARYDKVMIVGHLRPDGDCFGSCLGLLHALRNMGKQVRFYTYGPLPAMFEYLPAYEETETTWADPGEDTLTICVDTADPGRVHPGFYPPENTINIDHHISNTNFGAINWIDPAATAAAEQVYFLVEALGTPVTQEIATCIFTGLMTDTGGFRFANTDDTTFDVAAKMVKAGANPAKIAEAVWDSRSPAAVRLAGQVYESLKYEFDGRFVWNQVSRIMQVEAGGDQADTEGLSSDMRGIAGVEVSVLFTETVDGKCRIGFRSRGKVNVSTLAAMLNGGGHAAASGATLDMPYEQGVEHALKIIRSYLDSAF